MANKKVNIKARYKTWKKSLDIANIEYSEEDFWNNIDQITFNICNKYSLDYYKERYSCIFDSDTVKNIHEKNRAVINANRTNPYNIQDVMKKDGVSEEEAIEIIKERKQLTCGNLVSFIKRHGEEEGTRRYKLFTERCVNNLESFIEKYGSEEGPKLFEEYKKTKSSSLEMQKKRYGSELGEAKYNESLKKKKHSLSQQGFIERYGEEAGIQKYKTHTKNKSGNLKNFIRKYGEKEGTERYQRSCIKKSRGNTLNFYIEKYGEERGIYLYEEKTIKKSPIFIELKRLYGEEKAKSIYLNPKSKKYKKAKEIVIAENRSKFSKYKSKGPVSKSSTSFFDKIKDYFDLDLKYGKKNNELKIFDEEYMCNYYYDSVDYSKKLIIEFHGVAFHPKENELDWVGVYGETYESKRKKDLRKEEVAILNGYRYVAIWSDESLYEAYKKIEEFLDEENKKY